MNKQILELAKQFGPVATIGNWGRVEWADGVFPQLGDKMFAAIDLEKFAELIVLECLTKIETAAQQYHEPVWALELATDIMEHFGVEQ